MDELLWHKVLEQRSSLPKETFALLSKYRARANYCRAFRNVHTVEIGEELGEAYFVMLKLGLACTAIEVLHTVIPGKIRITSEQVDKALLRGEFEGLIESMVKNLDQKYDGGSGVRRRTYLKGSNQPHDLYKFMKDCRNLMFHGRFTPNEARLDRAKRKRELLLHLANVSLDQCDLALEKWIDGQRALRRRAEAKARR